MSGENKTTGNHLAEWRFSAINDRLTSLNCSSPKDGWNVLDWLAQDLGSSEKTNTGKPSKWFFDQYYSVAYGGGWLAKGWDILTGNPSDRGCFKPLEPRIDKEGKIIKYEVPTTKGNPDKASIYDCFFPRVDVLTWQETVTKHSLQSDYLSDLPSDYPHNNECSKDYWQWVINNPDVPILIDEGFKKACSTLSASYVALGLNGIWTGLRTPKDESGNKVGDSYLIPPLEKLAVPGREFIFCFDNDPKKSTRENVKNAIRNTSNLLIKKGAKVTVITWDYPEKGVDDLIAARGVEVFDELYKNRVDVSQYLSTEKVTDKKTPETLELEITAYLQLSNVFKKAFKKSEICRSYGIKDNTFEQLCHTLESQQSTPQKTVFTLAELFKLESKALQWVIPGLLPVGETVLLAAMAKTGKTLLGYDIAYAVVSGGQVLGETVTDKGKVLLVSSDESLATTIRRLHSRGFDLLPEEDNLRVISSLDILNLSSLEQLLEDFRPNLVIIDSLTSVTYSLGISEKDSEFARPIYKLKELLARYQASGILIHHENKDKDAKGINKVSGSARITAAVWGIWQLKAASNDEKDSSRLLTVKPREGEPVTLNLNMNPKELWCSSGIFEYLGEIGDEGNKKKTQGDLVVGLLSKYSPKGLESSEIAKHLNIEVKQVYRVLDRLVDRGIVSHRPSQTRKNGKVYVIPEKSDNSLYPGERGSKTVENNQNDVTPSLPTYSPSFVSEPSETITQQEIQNPDKSLTNPLKNPDKSLTNPLENSDNPLESLTTPLENPGDFLENRLEDPWTDQQEVLAENSKQTVPISESDSNQIVIGDTVLMPGERPAVVIKLVEGNAALKHPGCRHLVHWPIGQLTKAKVVHRK